MKSRQERQYTRTFETARKRLGRLDTASILDWCDQAGTGLALALQDYRREGRIESLREATDALACLEAAVVILTARG